MKQTQLHIQNQEYHISVLTGISAIIDCNVLRLHVNTLNIRSHKPDNRNPIKLS